MTLDPEHDTPAVLAAYAARWGLGADWRLLTGSPPTGDRLRRAYGVAAERLVGGEIAHENVIVLIDRAGRVAFRYGGAGQSVENLVGALERLASERA